ncbi:hypothetical protein JCM8097_002771 [Rhodosporidiobolus ruineniae]
MAPFPSHPPPARTIRIPTFQSPTSLAKQAAPQTREEEKEARLKLGDSSKWQSLNAFAAAGPSSLAHLLAKRGEDAPSTSARSASQPAVAREGEGPSKERAERRRSRAKEKEEAAAPPRPSPPPRAAPPPVQEPPAKRARRSSAAASKAKQPVQKEADEAAGPPPQPAKEKKQPRASVAAKKAAAAGTEKGKDKGKGRAQVEPEDERVEEGGLPPLSKKRRPSLAGKGPRRSSVPASPQPQDEPETEPAQQEEDPPAPPPPTKKKRPSLAGKAPKPAASLPSPPPSIDDPTANLALAPSPLPSPDARTAPSSAAASAAPSASTSNLFSTAATAAAAEKGMSSAKAKGKGKKRAAEPVEPGEDEVAEEALEGKKGRKRRSTVVDERKSTLEKGKEKEKAVEQEDKEEPAPKPKKRKAAKKLVAEEDPAAPVACPSKRRRLSPPPAASSSPRLPTPPPLPSSSPTPARASTSRRRISTGSAAGDGRQVRVLTERIKGNKGRLNVFDVVAGGSRKLLDRLRDDISETRALEAFNAYTRTLQSSFLSRSSLLTHLTASHSRVSTAKQRAKKLRLELLEVQRARAGVGAKMDAAEREWREKRKEKETVDKLHSFLTDLQEAAKSWQ